MAKEWRARKPTYDRALRDLEQTIERLLEKLREEELFRARLSPPSRVKEPSSIIRKAGKNGIALPDALDVLEDIVGVRVVCNNLLEVDKVIEAVSEHAGLEVLKTDPQEMLHRAVDGYRARHIVVNLTVYKGQEKQRMPVEVQVRTRLQDAWAHLAHKDFYKPEGQTLSWLEEQMKDLSDRLYELDRQAQDIRGAIEKHYTDLKHSLRFTVANKVSVNDLAGAMHAISESLNEEDTALRLAAVEVFVETPALWELGMCDFADAVSKMDEWMRIRVIDKLGHLAPEQVVRFDPVIAVP